MMDATAQPRASTRDQTNNIRVRPQQIDLIDQAASQLGQTRSAFMLERAVQAAEAVLLDQRLFVVNDATYDAFTARLNAPAEPNANLRALLSQPAPWDK